ncbi:3-hydroxyacyl-CoA dehydrogenase [Rossellomorea marisflavi]
MRNLVVVGSGVMGRGIAYVSAVGGYRTTLVDIKEEQLLRAEREIAGFLQKGIERQKLTADQYEEARGNLQYSTNLSIAVSDADFVIEAVPEDRELKRSVFQVLDAHAPESCYFATNTSTMSPTEIGSYTKRPQKVIAMHFFQSCT